MVRQKNAKIMMVSRDRGVSKLLKSRLESDGNHAEFCDSGSEFLTRLASEHFDIVLFDTSTPDMSGWEALQRAKSTRRDAKFILVSTIEISPERKIALMNNGLSDYLLKPLAREDFPEMARKVIL